MTTDSQIRDLPKFLTWSAGTELLDIVCDYYQSWIVQRLEAWSSAACPELSKAIHALPELNQQRLILSPQVCFLLRSKDEPTSQDVSDLMTFVEAEEYLCGHKRHMTREAVAAMGDYYFLHSGLGGALRVMQSPPVHHIVVDTANLRTHACWPPNSGSRARYTKTEIAMMRGRINESLDFIKTVHATPVQMVEKSIYVLGVMNLSGHPGECCSSSIGMMIGAAVLGNFHEQKWGVGKLADAFIHESIHNVIYKLELESGLHTDYAAALEACLPSPWSGQSLPLESFVHACFVWFGLLNFWNLSTLDNPEFRELRNIAGSGFLKEPLTSLLSAELRSYIKPEVLHALEEVWERVTPECIA